MVPGREKDGQGFHRGLIGYGRRGVGLGKKRICVYCDHWQNGGVESLLMNLLSCWDLSAAKCTLVTSDKTTNIYDEALRSLGVAHIVLMDRLYDSPIARILNNFSALDKHLTTHTYDTIYLNLGNSITMLYARGAKKHGVPSRIVHSHCSGIQSGVARPLKMLVHFLMRCISYKYATGYIASSDVAAAWLFPEKVLWKVHIIPNGIAVDDFHFNEEKRREQRLLLGIEDQYVVGTVGRFAPEKNQTFLLEIFVGVLRQKPNAALLLVGDGPLRSSLEAQARALGIYERCIFYGFTSDVPPLLFAMDAFCLPSFFEGNGIAAIEAQATGLPCLLSDTVPQSTKVLDETQHLPLGSCEPWVNALLEIGDAPIERSAATARVRAAGYDRSNGAKLVWQVLFDSN